MTRDRGQATVELALCLPVLCVLLLGIVQVAVVTRDRLAVQLAAREGARAAAIGADDAAVRRTVTATVALAPLTVGVDRRAGSARVTVAYREPTDVPLLGALLPDVEVRASVTMAVEPP